MRKKTVSGNRPALFSSRSDWTGRWLLAYFYFYVYVVSPFLLLSSRSPLSVTALGRSGRLCPCTPAWAFVSSFRRQQELWRREEENGDWEPPTGLSFLFPRLCVACCILPLLPMVLRCFLMLCLINFS